MSDFEPDSELAARMSESPIHIWMNGGDTGVPAFLGIQGWAEQMYVPRKLIPFIHELAIVRGSYPYSYLLPAERRRLEDDVKRLDSKYLQRGVTSLEIQATTMMFAQLEMGWRYFISPIHRWAAPMIIDPINAAIISRELTSITIPTFHELLMLRTRFGVRLSHSDEQLYRRLAIREIKLALKATTGNIKKGLAEGVFNNMYLGVKEVYTLWRASLQ